MADKNIKITVADKRATVDGTPVIVCGNSDYTATFTFDDEWDAEGNKTARFVFVKNGERKHQDVEFLGDTVPVPVLSDVAFVLVGVFAGELSTTTPAKVPCLPSILCDSGVEAEPPDISPSLYDQLVEQIYNDLFPLQLSADGTSYDNIGEAHIANNEMIKSNKQKIKEVSDQINASSTDSYMPDEWESGKIYEDDGTVMESSEYEETTGYLMLAINSVIKASGGTIKVYSYDVNTREYIGHVADIAKDSSYTVTETLLVRITADESATVIITKTQPSLIEKVEGLYNLKNVLNAKYPNVDGLTGLKGNGTNESENFAKLVNYCVSNNLSLYLPSGEYYVNFTFTSTHNYLTIFGEEDLSTVITGRLKTVNENHIWDSTNNGDSYEFVTGLTLKNLKLDGFGTSYCGLTYYGVGLTLENITVCNYISGGLSIGSPGGLLSVNFETSLQNNLTNVVCYDNNVRNIYYNGQSDSNLYNIRCYVTEPTSGYNVGFGVKASGCRVFGLHCWGNYEYSVSSSASDIQFTNCHLEGATVAKLHLKARCTFEGQLYSTAETLEADGVLFGSAIRNAVFNIQCRNLRYCVNINGNDSGNNTYIINSASNVENNAAFNTQALSDQSIANVLHWDFYNNDSGVKTHYVRTPNINTREDYLAFRQNVNWDFVDKNTEKKTFTVECGDEGHDSWVASVPGAGGSALVARSERVNANLALYSKGAGAVLLDGVKVVEKIKEIEDVSTGYITLYPYTETAKEIQSITYTDNGYGTITANGTATGISNFTLAEALILPKGDYILTGCPSGGSWDEYCIRIMSNIDGTYEYLAWTEGSFDAEFTLEETTTILIFISIGAGMTVENLTFEPVLKLRSSLLSRIEALEKALSS